MSISFKPNRKIEVVKSVQLFDVRYHPTEANILAASTIEGDVFIYDTGGEEKVDVKPKTELLKHHKGTPVRKVRFTEDGSLVTSAKTIKIFDLEASSNKFMLKRRDEKSARFFSLVVFDQNLICAGDDDGEFFMWDTRIEGLRPVIQHKECDQYISDMDADRGNKIVMCTSGEGTLTAFDIRAKKMVEPQSELFEAGFQCIKYMELNERAIVGAEDGSLYIFRSGEWAYTREKVPVTASARSRSKVCSVDCIDVLSGTAVIVGCSDGRLRAINLFPHKIIKESILGNMHRISIEALHVNPNSNSVATCEDNMITIVDYAENVEGESDADGDSANNSDSDTESSSDNDEENEKPEPKPKSARRMNSNPRSAFFSDLAG